MRLVGVALLAKLAAPPPLMTALQKIAKFSAMQAGSPLCQPCEDRSAQNE